MLPGCLYDADHACGDTLVQEGHGSDARCLCPPGSYNTGTTCVQCGEHEVATATSCDCEPGFSRPSAGAPCTNTPPGLGMECDPSASTCPTEFDHCEPAGSSGYCTTSGCTPGDDCSGGYVCNDMSVCQRPPTGLGTSCTSAADCAAFEATFCDTIMTHGCLVQGCSLEPDDCFSGYECCDLSMFGLPAPLCVPAGGCPT